VTGFADSGTPGDILVAGAITMNVLAAGLAVSVAFLWAAHVGAQSAPDFPEGEPFPPIVLPEVDASGRPGEPMSIADFRGQKIILHLFASW
jgi:hypothetical protein